MLDVYLQKTNEMKFFKYRHFTSTYYKEIAARKTDGNFYARNKI